MKIRWTQSSLRLRISPRELQALHNGEPVREEFAVPGSGKWSAEIRPRSQDSTLTLVDGKLSFFLSDADLKTLSDPKAEGVYLEWKGQTLKYFIEKDFPCAHPPPGGADEPPTETFQPTQSFKDRK
jgi:hypothetical protein